MKILPKLYKKCSKRIKLIKKGKRYCDNINEYHIKNWIEIIGKSITKYNMSNHFDIFKNTKFLYSTHLFNTPTYYLDLVDINNHSHVDTPLMFTVSRILSCDDYMKLENAVAEMISDIDTYNRLNNLDFIKFSIDRCIYCHLPNKISIVISLSDIEGILNDV